MSCVAVVEATRLQVDQSDEHGDKHALLVALRQYVVHARGYLGRLHVLRGQNAEQASGLGHEQRGGNALAADVAHTEIQLVVEYQVAIEVAAHLAGGGHRGIHVEALPGGEDVGHHRHLDVAGNAQLTLYALLGLRGSLQLTVGRLQLLVGILQLLVSLLQALGGLALVEGIEEQEDDCEEQGHQSAHHLHLRHLRLLACYLCLLLIGMVDGGQLGRGAALLAGDGRVEERENADTHLACRVFTMSLVVGTVFGQHIQLDDIQRGLQALLLDGLVEIAVVVGSLTVAPGRDEVAIAMDAPYTRLREGCKLETLIGLVGLLVSAQTLQGCGAHNLDTTLVFVKILLAGIFHLAILVEQHLRAVYPVDRLFVAARVDICHAGIYRAQHGLLIAAAGSVGLPAVGIAVTGLQETLLGFLLLTQIQLADTNVVEENGIVDVRADARFVHAVNGGNSYLQRSVVVATHHQQLRQAAHHLIIYQLVEIGLHLIVQRIAEAHLCHAILVLVMVVIGAAPAVGIELVDVARSLKTVDKGYQTVVLHHRTGGKNQTVGMTGLQLFALHLTT